MAPTQLPEWVVLGDEAWRVARAWPDRGPRLSVELRLHGRIRGGSWDAGRLTALVPGTDPALPALAEALTRTAGTVVSHRPGKRAVVRGADGAFTKVVRRKRAAKILQGMDHATTFASAFRTPEVLAHGSSTVTFSAVAGASLHDATSWSDELWHRAWDETLTAWMAAVSRTAPPAPVHDVAAEVRVLDDWTSKAVFPEGDAQLRLADARDGAVAALSSLPDTESWRPIHRDLHDKQLLWHPNLGPGIIDLDTACLGDPALDLGNLRAHARLRRLQRLWTDAQSTTVRDAVDRAASQLGCPTASIDAYEQSALVRLACVYSFRPRWRRLAPALLG
ncbi:phosphotransferase [Tessaracoccus caeni]|uniref:phosphotransferase n=1 Tax=Tessaracoccus caeni TaxID=3031239 RepID=UPI0023DAE4E4|nr:phosphotransferase [Tessaracoccus caeni]MDF1488556.1 phosphotransferase [Tessaracoccus caeni]